MRMINLMGTIIIVATSPILFFGMLVGAVIIPFWKGILAIHHIIAEAARD